MQSREATPNLELPDRLTERDLADHWRVTVRTLQRWRTEGRSPEWMRVGTRILYSRAAVYDFETRGRNGGAAS